MGASSSNCYFTRGERRLDKANSFIDNNRDNNVFVSDCCCANGHKLSD